MSVDLDILPTALQLARWGDIKYVLKELLGPSEVLLEGHISLVELHSKTIVSECERLMLNSHYYFVLSTPNTLGLSVSPNKGNLDEHIYLEDFGRNLTPLATRSLVERWHAAGCIYAVTSMGGRSLLEPKIFVALATAIAYISKGYVIVMDNGIFDVSIGIYSAEQFKRVKPLF